MAKRFFYVAAGIFLLVAAYQLGAERARADWDPSGSGYVLGAGGPQLVWSSLGEMYQWSIPESGDVVWTRGTGMDLPVPAADIKLLSCDSNSYATVATLVTREGVIWVFRNEWRLAPPVPGGPVPVQGRSFGATKAKYRR